MQRLKRDNKMAEENLKIAGVMLITPKKNNTPNVMRRAYAQKLHAALRAVKYTVPSSFTSMPSLAAIVPTRSTRRVEYPHSLSYHETNLTKVGVSIIPASASKTVEHVSPTKSEETTWSSV